MEKKNSFIPKSLTYQTTLVYFEIGFNVRNFLIILLCSFILRTFLYLEHVYNVFVKAQIQKYEYCIYLHVCLI